MKKIRKTLEAARKILELFQSGNVPKALAPHFLRDRSGKPRPIDAWSWGNKLLAAAQGHLDARGFRQWQEVGRNVKRGERAVWILAPCTRKVRDDDDDGNTSEKVVCVGFRTIPVFGYSQTEGEELIEGEQELLDSLPLREVATAWGIRVQLETGPGPRLGCTDTRSRITLAVKNRSTWAHELIHCADARLQGGLRPGQHAPQELVAELGGAILLYLLGQHEEADLGGCWEYIQGYYKTPDTALRAAFRLLERTCKAVDLILETARGLGDRAAA